MKIPFLRNKVEMEQMLQESIDLAERYKDLIANEAYKDLERTRKEIYDRLSVELQDRSDAPNDPILRLIWIEERLNRQKAIAEEMEIPILKIDVGRRAKLMLDRKKK